MQSGGEWQFGNVSEKFAFSSAIGFISQELIERYRGVDTKRLLTDFCRMIREMPPLMLLPISSSISAFISLFMPHMSVSEGSLNSQSAHSFSEWLWRLERAIRKFVECVRGATIAGRYYDPCQQRSVHLSLPVSQVFYCAVAAVLDDEKYDHIHHECAADEPLLVAGRYERVKRLLEALMTQNWLGEWLAQQANQAKMVGELPVKYGAQLVNKLAGCFDLIYPRLPNICPDLAVEQAEELAAPKAACWHIITDIADDCRTQINVFLAQRVTVYQYLVIVELLGGKRLNLGLRDILLFESYQQRGFLNGALRRLLTPLLKEAREYVVAWGKQHFLLADDLTQFLRVHRIIEKAVIDELLKYFLHSRPYRIASQLKKYAGDEYGYGRWLSGLGGVMAAIDAVFTWVDRWTENYGDDSSGGNDHNDRLVALGDGNQVTSEMACAHEGLGSDSATMLANEQLTAKRLMILLRLLKDGCRLEILARLRLDCKAVANYRAGLNAIFGVQKRFFSAREALQKMDELHPVIQDFRRHLAEISYFAPFLGMSVGAEVAASARLKELTAEDALWAAIYCKWNWYAFRRAKSAERSLLVNDSDEVITIDRLGGRPSAGLAYPCFSAMAAGSGDCAGYGDAVFGMVHNNFVRHATAMLREPVEGGGMSMRLTLAVISVMNNFLVNDCCYGDFLAWAIKYEHWQIACYLVMAVMSDRCCVNVMKDCGLLSVFYHAKQAAKNKKLQELAPKSGSAKYRSRLPDVSGASKGAEDASDERVGAQEMVTVLTEQTDFFNVFVRLVIGAVSGSVRADGVFRPLRLLNATDVLLLHQLWAHRMHDGKNLLTKALQRGDSQAAHLIFETIKGQYGNEVFRFWLTSEGSDGENLLLCAIMAKDADFVKCFFEKCRDLYDNYATFKRQLLRLDEHCRTPLGAALNLFNIEEAGDALKVQSVLMAILHAHAEVEDGGGTIKEALQQCDCNGYTPLMQAISTKRVGVVQLLLATVSQSLLYQVMLPCIDGERPALSPLHLAVMMGKHDVVQALLRKCKDVVMADGRLLWLAMLERCDQAGRGILAFALMHQANENIILELVRAAGAVGSSFLSGLLSESHKLRRVHGFDVAPGNLLVSRTVYGTLKKGCANSNYQAVMYVIERELLTPEKVAQLNEQVSQAAPLIIQRPAAK